MAVVFSRVNLKHSNVRILYQRCRRVKRGFGTIPCSANALNRDLGFTIRGRLVLVVQLVKKHIATESETIDGPVRVPTD